MQSHIMFIIMNVKNVTKDNGNSFFEVSEGV